MARGWFPPPSCRGWSEPTPPLPAVLLALTVAAPLPVAGNGLDHCDARVRAGPGDLDAYYCYHLLARRESRHAEAEASTSSG